MLLVLRAFSSGATAMTGMYAVGVLLAFTLSQTGMTWPASSWRCVPKKPGKRPPMPRPPKIPGRSATS